VDVGVLIVLENIVAHHKQHLELQSSFFERHPA
jgi:hypothetical protein